MFGKVPLDGNSLGIYPIPKATDARRYRSEGVLTGMMTDQVWRFEPQKDITTYELAQIVSLLTQNEVNSPHRWLEDRPELLRHFEQKSRGISVIGTTTSTVGMIQEIE